MSRFSLGPPGQRKCGKEEVKTSPFPGAGSSAIVGDDGMNELNLQAAFHILVNADMRLAVTVIKRPGTQLIDVTVVIPQNTFHSLNITSTGCVDYGVG